MIAYAHMSRGRGWRAIAGWYAVIVVGGTLALFLLPVGDSVSSATTPVLLEELGRGIPIKQTFAVPSHGAHAVSIQLWASARANVTLEFQLTLSDTTAGSARLTGTRRLRLAGFEWVRFDFPATERPSNTLGTLVIRATAVAGQRSGVGPSLAAVALSDRPIAGRNLWVGDDERSGVLRLVTPSASDTVFGRFKLRTLPALPRPLQSSIAAIGLLIAFSLVLIPLLGVLLGAPVSTPAQTTGRRSRLVAVLGTVVCLLSLGGFGGVIWAARSERPLMLIDRLPAASITTDGVLNERVSVIPVGIGPDTKRAIFAHSTTTIRWRLVPRQRARLSTALGLAPGIWDSGGDGVVFHIALQDGREIVDVLRQQVDPHHVPSDRRWIPIEVDLSRYAGRPIELMLTTEPSPEGRPPDGSYDWALWGEPSVVTPGTFTRLEPD
jgi:hypothetical protein